MEDFDTAAPPAVTLVRDFVNTYEPQVDEESIPEPASLRDWLAERGLVEPDAQLTDTDAVTARTVREGLRSVLLDHAGHEPDPAAIEALNAVLAAVPMTMTFDAGAYRLAPAGGSAFDAALTRLADAVREATEDRTWHRLKVCARDTCRWAFYDASRNQTRRWCSMAGCGNYVKMKRAYATRTGRVTPAG